MNGTKRISIQKARNEEKRVGIQIIVRGRQNREMRERELAEDNSRHEREVGNAKQYNAKVK